MASGLGTLDPGQHGAVLAALGAVEVAEGPVRAEDFRALAEPALRDAVDALLRATGRVLLRVGDGWLSGYDDTIADRLADEGVGVLAPTDRAVLTLVLLRTVAIPRAQGRIADGDWTAAEPTTIDELAKSRHLTKQAIRASVRRLRTAGLLKPGLRPVIVPGPQFLRLTEARSRRLWEDLILLCQPDGMAAEVIRRRRTSTDREDAA